MAASLKNDPLPLYLLSQDESVDKGAVCLDGTAPGFYHSFTNNSGFKSKWVLYFKGGGWCYDEDSCAERANSSLGSSKHFAPTFEFSGLADSDPLVNPTFADYNRVIFWYCDGASFTGNNSEPYVSQKTNQTLYFRGFRVLNAMLDTLVRKHNLNEATDVLVSGGSAGGLAAYLHADYIGDYLRRLGAPLRRFKAAPVSGFFLMHPTADGEMLYPDEMKYVYNMQDSRSGVNPRCIDSYSNDAEGSWRCIFANESYAHSVTPMFPLNSALDAWQMGNIWKGNKACVSEHGHLGKDCTAKDISDLSGYIRDFLADLRSSPKFSRDGEGGFVETCVEHCGAQNAEGFTNYKIRNTTLRDALEAWWDGGASEPAERHWYLPCELNKEFPFQCNPSCAL